MKNQIFRFCLMCLDERLIIKGSCSCCNSDFIFSGLKDTGKMQYNKGQKRS